LTVTPEPTTAVTFLRSDVPTEKSAISSEPTLAKPRSDWIRESSPMSELPTVPVAIFAPVTASLRISVLPTAPGPISGFG
jgi:hypothetical protein